MKNHNFRNLKVWQQSIELVVDVYKHSKHFPKEEMFGLTSQIRRSAVSVPSNIAEGSAKSSEKDFARYLEISMGSSYEVETQLIIANRLSMLPSKEFDQMIDDIHEVQRMIAGLSKSLSSNF
ncbi:four helix bundle protein [Cesiribacter andamanensis]|uniref:Four helix bundle protein n=1 Tax=Cesiribacter andamanensis AMV16 TaxID=1279009 RepID=M7NC30_9BACT|nr:four helix bundle protein [Cesiribacter andamanensis]EMR04726.1 hypothetical protein ADICEAN_00178 [Cesiribacter andamanensis AMV16]